MLIVNNIVEGGSKASFRYNNSQFDDGNKFLFKINIFTDK